MFSAPSAVTAQTHPLLPLMRLQPNTAVLEYLALHRYDSSSRIDRSGELLRGLWWRVRHTPLRTRMIVSSPAHSESLDFAALPADSRAYQLL